jgi:tetratricopeptide (TPR) repeat protein
MDCEDSNRYYGYAMQPCVGNRLNRTKLPLSKEALLKRALVPWVTLSERSPYDQAVQESWVAIPYALQQLGAYEQAAEYYELAIKRLDALRETYAAAIAAADAGSLLPAPNLDATISHALPDARFDQTHADTLALLFEAVPENIWNTALKDEHDLNWLAHQFDVLDPSVDPTTNQSDQPQTMSQCGLPLATDLLTISAELHANLERQAANELRKQDTKLVQYLLSAREARAKSLEGLWTEQNTAAGKPEESKNSVAGFFHSIKTLFAGDAESAPAVLPEETVRP